MNQCQSIDELAQELLTMIERYSLQVPDLIIHSLVCSNGFDHMKDLPFSFYSTLLTDLENYGWEHVQSLTDSLQKVTIAVADPSGRSHDVEISFPATYPEGVPSCHLSLPEDYIFQWNKTNSLRDIHNTVIKVLEKYNDVWTVLEDMDKHCLILDPSKPTFGHNYRRIFLGTSFGICELKRISVHCTIL